MKFKLILLSAMYENGGNTTHRFFDGHPELHVYPFESQIGNTSTLSAFSSLFPPRYEWPSFSLTITPQSCYEMFWDEEMKSKLRVPHVSKFRKVSMDLDEHQRKEIFCDHLEKEGMTQRNIIMAYYKSTFDAWKDLNRTGKEHFYVGYNPVVGVHAEQILMDIPDGHVIHVVRNPYSAFADTSKRPYPLSLYNYCIRWSIVQLMALTMAKRHPHRFHIIRFEDLIEKTEDVMRNISDRLGIEFSDKTLYPSWNSKKMDEVYPWGTIKRADSDTNLATMNELSKDQIKEIRSLTSPMLEKFDYL